MSSEITIRVQNLSKCYQIYEKPHDRLKQSIYPRIQRAVGIRPRQYYREFWALKDVSFEIKKGETVGIIGRNGSGKSTLLQMICGTLNPTSGNIETHGRIAALLELGSGFNPEFTGRENIYMNAAVLGLRKEEIDARYDSIVAFADIGEFIEQPVKTYSSGMFVRLAFAIQANVDPEVLIVDEALAVGDAYFVHRCMLRFSELQKAGITILFVSHDANFVRNLCTRAIWLAEGGVRSDGNASKVVDAYLAHLFKREVVTGGVAIVPNVKGADQDAETSLNMETSIPNIDRRLGDQRCQIVGVGLYDESMNRISATFGEKVVVLRISIKNNSLGPSEEMVVGYIFRNAKGQEIASTNSQIENEAIGPMPEDGYITIRLGVSLPCLHPGSYAFTVTAGYFGDSEEIVLSDRIENAIALDVASRKHVHVMMNFKTTIDVEV